MTKKFTILILSAISTILISANVTVHGQENVYPEVVTPLGTIRGLRATDGNYSMFMGIPYATVNESNPFGAAIPNPMLGTVFNAFDDSSICPQVEEFNNTIVGTLDCLHLNIYVPDTASAENKLPVLIWIHGGGFNIGFAGRYLYGPKFLVNHDVIFVTSNYRLGPYGFMSLNTPDIPGNAGLKDQILTLRWLKDNIEYFNGDSERVTIHGESSSAMGFDILMHSEVDIPFSGAILHSGSGLHGIVREPDTEAPLKLSGYLGLETSDIDDAVSFLTSLDPLLIIEATTNLRLSFTPSIELQFEDVEGIIYEDLDTLSTPKVRNISILMAFNNHETLLSWANRAPENYGNPFTSASINLFSSNTKIANEIEGVMKYFYIGDEDINPNVIWDLVDFSTDNSYFSKICATTNKYMKNGAQNMFKLVFSYSGQRNFVKQRNNVTIGGACHADEMGYLFDISYLQDSPITSEDQLIIDRITTIWANFAKHGHPIPEPTDLLPVRVERMTEDVFHYFELDLQMSTGKRVYHKRQAVWDLLYRLSDKMKI